jgi:hypothetical protein
MCIDCCNLLRKSCDEGMHGVMATDKKFFLKGKMGSHRKFHKVSEPIRIRFFSQSPITIPGCDFHCNSFFYKIELM